MGELIIKTRVKPKNKPANIISRQRILRLFSENSDKNILAVVSPAGYGKTTAVLDFLNSLNIKYTWFQVSEDIPNIFTFITYIVHSLKYLKQDFGEDTLLLIHSLQESSAKSNSNTVKDISATFINEFCSCFTDEIYLVIDDLHNITGSEWLTLYFENLESDFPQNLHIIITSREIMPFNVSRLLSKRRFFSISQSDLEFNKDEIIRIVNEIYSTSISKKEIDFLETKLKGWVTGIHLIIQASRSKQGNIDFSISNARENFFSFFANDIFEALDNNTKNFLLKTSILNEFTLASISNIPGFNTPELIIKLLVSKNLFIEQSVDKDTGEIVYSYHNLFRDYLRSKFNEGYSEKEKNEYFENLSEIFIKENEINQAVEILSNINKFKDCIELILKNYKSYLTQNRDDVVWKWLNRVPIELINKNPELLYLRGLLYKRYIGDLEKAAENLKFAAELDKGGNISLISNLEYALILLTWTKINESITLLEELLPQEKNKVNKANILFILADAYHRLGYNMDTKIFPLINEALNIAAENDMVDLKTNIYDLLGRAYHARGIFIKSAYYYELALKNTTLVYYRLRILSNIITINCNTGNFDKAYELITEAEEIVKQFPSPTLKFNILRTKATFSYDTGDFERARDLFEEIIKISAENSQITYQMWYYLQMGESYFFQDNPGKAKSYYDIASKYIDESYKVSVIEVDKYKLLLPETDPVLFETEYLKILKELEEQDFAQDITTCHLYLANHYYVTKQYSASLEHLRTALDVSAKNLYLADVELMFLKFRYLFDFAIANNIQTKFIKDINLNLIDRINAPFISKQYRKRLKENIGKLYDIDIKTFGAVEISVRGNLVTEEKWIRKKSKSIFLYLLLNSEFKFTKDKIMDLFFPESSPETADNIFHQVISNIRNVTRVNSEAADNKAKSKSKDSSLKLYSDFVIYEDKVLRVNENYIYKIDAIDFDRNYRIFKSSETGKEEKAKTAAEAVKLYNGEILAGIYETWCEDLREMFNNKYLALCEFLIEFFKEKKVFYEAIEYAEKLLVIDKLNENANINIIECLCELGNYSAARNIYQQFNKACIEECGEYLSKSLQSQIEKLLQNSG